MINIAHSMHSAGIFFINITRCSATSFYKFTVEIPMNDNVIEFPYYNKFYTPISPLGDNLSKKILLTLNFSIIKIIVYSQFTLFQLFSYMKIFKFVDKFNEN